MSDSGTGHDHPADIPFPLEMAPLDPAPTPFAPVGVPVRGQLDGLGRFLAPRRGSTPSGYGPTAVPGLKRFLEPRKRAIPGERCEFCAEDIREPHSHVVNVESRSLMCACRGCWMLFTSDGAAGGRYRAVPEDTILDPDFVLTDGQWDSLQIPVGMAFFFHQSDAAPATTGHPVAFYPSPAGATESLLPLDVWDELVAANPTLGRMLPDVQALLVHRPRNGEPRCFIVPIDACYALVGSIRRYWKGFDGGEEAWREIGAFFDALAERSRPPARVVGAGATATARAATAVGAATASPQ